MSINMLAKLVNKLVKEIDEFYITSFSGECIIKLINNEHIVIRIHNWRNAFNIRIDAKGNVYMEDSSLSVSSLINDEERAKRWILSVIDHINKVLLAGEI